MDGTSLQTIGMPWLSSLGWALVHSLWQLALIGLVYAGFKFALKDITSARRSKLLYGAGCIAMLTMLLVPASTFGILLHQHNASIAGRTETAIPFVAHPESMQPGESSTMLDQGVLAKANLNVEPGALESTSLQFDSAAQSIQHQKNSLLTTIAFCWFAGVLLFLLRPIVGMLHANNLARRHNRPLADRWQKTAAEVCKKLKIDRAVKFAESASVQVPTVVGYLNPVVLIPAAALTGLTPQQLKLILAHELAHIRRHDFLINFVQTVAESLLFYHPAAWWLSSQIRCERENCCDDVAAQMDGDPESLAHALFALEESRVTAPALAATGGSLSRRIHRLLNINTSKQPPFAGIATLAIACLLSTIALSNAIGNAVNTQDDEQPRPPSYVVDTDSKSTTDQEIPAQPALEASNQNSANDESSARDNIVNRESTASVLAIITADQESAENCREMALNDSTRDHFEQLARQFSIDEPSRTMNGAVPPIRRGLGQPELEEVAFSLKRGQISKVVQVKDRWVVLYGLGVINSNVAKQAEQNDEVIIKTYCVADLIATVAPFAAPFSAKTEEGSEKEIDAEPLIALIKSAIKPESWENHTLLYHEETLSLIVSHEKGVHQQVRDLFEKLRQLTEITIVTRGFLVSISQEELDRFPLFRDGLGEDPSTISLRSATTLNAIALAKDSVQLQYLPTDILFNGQTQKAEIEVIEGMAETQLAFGQLVSQTRDSIRVTVAVKGENAPSQEPQVFECNSGQLMAVDLSKALNLEGNQRAILVFKSDISIDVE